MSSAMRLIRASAVLVALAAVPVEGQRTGSWVFTPYVGAYVPTADLTRFELTDAGATVVGKVKHDNGVALGGNLSYWFGERVGMEFGAAYAWSQANIRSDVESLDDNSFIRMGTAKVMLALVPTSEQMQLRFGIGPAIINRGGTAYKEDEGKFSGLTSVGGVASLCTRVPLRGGLSLRLRAEDYVYQSRLKFNDPSDPLMNPVFDRKLQNDLIFSAGLQIGLGR